MTEEVPETGRDFTEILYKYTDYDGAEKILSTRTLKFAHPSEFNDPFDVHIADLFSMDLDEFFEESRNAWFDALLSDPEKLARLMGDDLSKTRARAKTLKNMSTAQREQLNALLDNHPERRMVRAMLEQEREQFLARFSRYGIFGATRTFSNLLMWAHYADKHRGRHPIRFQFQTGCDVV